MPKIYQNVSSCIYLLKLAYTFVKNETFCKLLS